MARFTEQDLQKLGLKDNGDGTFSKTKTIPQPRENKIQPISIKQEKKKESTYWKGMNIKDIFADATANNYIFIPHNVPSSKNSKRAFKKIVLESEICVAYRKNTDIHWQVFKSRFLRMIEGKEKPYRVEMTFIRNSKHKADYHNLVQLPADLFVKYRWIEDDNMDEILFIPPIKPYAIDKNIPGVIIKVL